MTRAQLLFFYNLSEVNELLTSIKAPFQLVIFIRNVLQK